MSAEGHSCKERFPAYKNSDILYRITKGSVCSGLEMQQLD